MVYQLLKDIEQLLGGKESLTAAEQSILERSSKVISTMRNPEDTELLKKDELLIRYCPATKHPVLVYYDGDGMCSCMHNDTIAEDIEDVKRWLEDATSATPNDTMSYQTEETVLDDILSSEENCETFMEVVMEEIQSDEETYRHKAHQLIQAYREDNCGDMLMALCGWSMHTLLIKYQQRKEAKNNE